MIVDLFTTPFDESKRVPVRPLGIFSDYVVAQMPLDLKQVRTGVLSVSELSSRIERVFVESRYPFEALEYVYVGGMGWSSGGYFPALRPEMERLALADALMVDTALAHLGGTAPALRRYIRFKCFMNGRIPVMRYDDLLLTNPIETDPRLFTADEVGAAEFGFYLGHLHVERLLERVVALLAIALSGGSVNTDVLIRARDLLEGFPEMMRMFHSGALKAPFAIFRPYLVSYPGTSYKGPSGAFSASVCTIDVLLDGTALDRERLAWIRAHRQYMPEQHLPPLDRALFGARWFGKTLARRASGTNLELVREMKQIMADARRSHMGAVARQIPEVLKEGGVGTAGITEVNRFLRGRIDE